MWPQTELVINLFLVFFETPADLGQSMAYKTFV